MTTRPTTGIPLLNHCFATICFIAIITVVRIALPRESLVHGESNVLIITARAVIAAADPKNKDRNPYFEVCLATNRKMEMNP